MASIGVLLIAGGLAFLFAGAPLWLVVILWAASIPPFLLARTMFRDTTSRLTEY